MSRIRVINVDSHVTLGVDVGLREERVTLNFADVQKLEEELYEAMVIMTQGSPVTLMRGKPVYVKAAAGPQVPPPEIEHKGVVKRFWDAMKGE